MLELGQEQWCTFFQIDGLEPDLSIKTVFDKFFDALSSFVYLFLNTKLFPNSVPHGYLIPELELALPK